MHFEFLSRLNGIVFYVWICLKQVLILTMTQKHKLYQSVYTTLILFLDKVYTTLILLKTRNTYQESTKDAWPILQSKFNSRE